MSTQENKREHVWTWPIATYLFLGGLGAAMTLVAVMADLVLGLGQTFAFCIAGAIVCLGLGSALLIFELGRPFAFWRVFSKQRAVLTFGAWMVILLVVIDVVYFSFHCGWLPWSTTFLEPQSVGASVCALVALLLSCGVMIYTGVELSSMKARSFWNSPVLPVLFVVSAILTGSGADALVIGLFLPWSGSVLGAAVAAAGVAVSLGVLYILMMATVVGTLFVVMVYVLMMYTSSDGVARIAAKRWLSGQYALAFWGGLVLAGLLLPVALLLFGGSSGLYLASLLVIVGGVILRFLVVYSDDRRQFAGEELRRSRLPVGDEPFLKRDWG